MKLTIGGLLVCFLLTACGGGSSPASTVEDRIIASVAVSDGNSQTATVGSELPTPLVAVVLNKSGQPIPGQIVNFVVTSGGGSVFAGAALTDANGIARERWTLGTTVGTQTVEVRAVDGTGAAVVFATFNATATAAAPQTLSILSGNGQSAAQLQLLPAPVQVIVKDIHGNPVPDVPVVFTAGSGSVQPATTTTDAAGTASAAWTMGTAIGPHSLTASVSGLPSVTFSATASQAPAGVATTLRIAAGDSQGIVQHRKLPVSLKAVVTDNLGNPVPGAQVNYAAAAGSGYIKPEILTTNNGGVVEWLGYLHVAGQQKIDASLPGIATVTFNVNVSPSAHPYDGWYQCSVTNSSITYFQLSIIDGIITSNGEGRGLGNPNHIVGNGTPTGLFSEVDGALTANLEIGLGPTDPFRVPLALTGQLAIDNLERGTGSGTHVNSLTSEGGTWACERLYKW